MQFPDQTTLSMGVDDLYRSTIDQVAVYSHSNRQIPQGDPKAFQKKNYQTFVTYTLNSIQQKTPSIITNKPSRKSHRNSTSIGGFRKKGFEPDSTFKFTQGDTYDVVTQPGDFAQSTLGSSILGLIPEPTDSNLLITENATPKAQSVNSSPAKVKF